MSIKPHFELVWESLKTVEGIKPFTKNLVKFPFDKTSNALEYNKKNISALLQNIAIIYDIFTSKDKASELMMLDPSLFNSRDIYINKDSKNNIKTKKNQYVDFKINGFLIEYKCSTFVRDDYIEKKREKLNKKYSESNLITIVKILNLNYKFFEKVTTLFHELDKVSHSINHLLSHITKNRMRHRTANKYDNYLYQEDINVETVDNLLEEQYNILVEAKMDAVVKQVEEDLHFDKLNFKEEEEREWKNRIREFVKQTPKGHAFLQANALRTKDIFEQFEFNKNFDANSFNRDDSDTKRRLKNVMNVLPNRDYIQIQENSNKERLIDLLQIIDEKYCKGILSGMTKVINNFMDYLRFNECARIISEKKSEEKTIIADKEVQEVTIEDILERRQDRIRNLHIPDSYRGIELILDNYQKFFKTKSTMHMSIESFPKDTNGMKKKPKAVAEIKDYEKYMYDKLEHHRKSNFETINHPLLDDQIKDVYSNPYINDLMNKNIKLAANKIKENMNTNFYRVLEQQDIIFTEIMISMLKTLKQAEREDYVVIYHEQYGYYSISFRSTGVSSGMLMFFGSYKGNKPFNDLYPEYYSNYDSELNITNFITKPISISMENIKIQKENKYNWLIKCREFNEYNIEIEKDFLFFSLFTMFNSNVQSAIMMMYFMYKNSSQEFSIGKNQILEKITPEVISDARLATVIFRLKMNWKSFMNNIEKGYTKYRPELCCYDCKDPIFGFQHKSMETIFSLQFLKSVLPKNEGIDALNFTSKAIKKELQHKETYLKCSSFLRQKAGKVNISVTEFYDNVFKDNLSKWEDITWHPDTVIQGMHRMVQISEKHNGVEGLKRNIVQNMKREIMKQSKTTSINTVQPDQIEERQKLYAQKRLKQGKEITIEGFIKHENKSGNMLGIYSEPLAFSQLRLIMKLSEDLKRYASSKGFIWKGFNKLPQEYLIARYCQHLAIDELITTIHVKDQRGDKRVFFMMNEKFKYINSITDGIVQQILKNTPGDSIAKAGPNKLIDIEETFKDKLMDINKITTNITCDETRYGDCYPVEVLIYMFKVLLERELITKQEYKFIIYALIKIKNRKIMINPKTVDHCKNIMGMTEEKRSVYLNQREVMQVIISAYKMKFSMDGDENVNYLFRENKWIEKFVGFILGNMNFVGSACTYMHAQMVIDGLKEIFPEYEKIFAKTHSDDEFILTSLRCSKFKNIYINKFMDDIRLLILRRERLIIKEDGIYKVTLREVKQEIQNQIIRKDISVEEKTEYTEEEVGIFVYIMSFMSPRLFGQCPSPTKWTLGKIPEMFQVPTVNGKCFEPITKWMLTVTQSPMNKSYGTDIVDMVSRMNAYWTNGGTEVMSTCCLLFANLYVSERYGINKKKSPNLLRFDLPVSLGGILIYLPFLNIRTGYATNEIRLATLSKFSNKALSMASKTSDVWIKEENALEEENNILYTSIKFDIVTSAKTKLVKSFKNLLEIAQRNNIVPQDIDGNNIKEFKEKIVKHFEENKLRFIIQRRSPETLTLKRLYNVTRKSNQESSLDKGGYWSSKVHGYCERLFRNPFEEGGPLSFKSIVNLFCNIVENTTDIIENPLKIFYEINKDEINYLKNVIMDFKMTKEINYEKFANMKFKRISETSNLISQSIAHVILSLYCEVGSSINDNITLFKTMTYKYNENKIQPGFKQLYNNWVDLFNKIGLSQREALDKYNQLINFMATIDKNLVIKTTDDKLPIIEDRIINNFSLNYRITLRIRVNQELPEFKVAKMKARSSFSFSYKDRLYIVALGLTIAEMHGLNPNHINLNNNQLYFPILNLYQQMSNNIINIGELRDYNKDNLNSYLLGVLISKFRGKTRQLEINRKMIEFDKYIIGNGSIINELLSNNKTPLSVKENIKEDIKLINDNWSKGIKNTKVREYTLYSRDNQLYVWLKVTIFDYWSETPCMILQTTTDSQIEWTLGALNFIKYFIFNKEKRNMPIIDINKTGTFKMMRYKDLTVERINMNNETDMRLEPISIVNSMDRGFENKLEYFKDKIRFRKEPNWPIQVISPWLRKQLQNQLVYTDEKGKVIYNDRYSYEAKRFGFQEFVDELKLNSLLSRLLQYNWGTNKINDLDMGTSRMSKINNYLINIKSLNSMYNMLVNSSLLNEYKAFLEILSLNANSLMKAYDLNNIIACQRSTWSSLTTILESLSEKEINNLMPRLWLFREQPSEIISESKLLKIQFRTYIMTRTIDLQLASNIINLQKARGNTNISIVIKIIEGYIPVNSIEEKEKVSLLYLLRNDQLVTNFRIDYCILLFYKTMITSEPLRNIMAVNSIIKNDILLEKQINETKKHKKYN